MTRIAADLIEDQSTGRIPPSCSSTFHRTNFHASDLLFSFAEGRQRHSYRPTNALRFPFCEE
ncbi:hypothetical protein AJ87_45520 [Rhizobium yanglingense]|nr:hypothetical protein AJ87_45520 [Rhizobium yanglingense]